MYPLFLILAVAFVILSPLAFDLWLTSHENLKARRQAQQIIKATHPDLAWASPRLR